MFKKVFLSIITLFFVSVSFAQSIKSTEEKISEMMNNGQWFELRDFFKTNTDSISPFLNQFSNAMLAHFFNNPEKAVCLSQSLINDYNEELGLDNFIAISQMMALDLGILGKNKHATDVLNQMLDSTKQYFDSITTASFQEQIDRYLAFSKYKPYRVSMKTSFSSIPIRIDTLLITEKNLLNLFLYFPDCEINNVVCDVQFDTGAGMNVISTRLAKDLGLKYLGSGITARGIKEVQDVPIAIADSLKMGDVTLYDVPFLVLDIKTGHEIFDSQLRKNEIIIGFEVMNALKHLKFDFKNSCLTFSDKSFVPETEEPNMMIANGNMLVVKGSVNNYPILIFPDCGDVSSGIFFGNSWKFMKTFLSENQQPRKALFGGSGGYEEVYIYSIQDIPLTIGNTTVSIPQIDLSETYSDDDCNVRIGLKTFLLFENISFDMERMVMSTAQSTDFNSDKIHKLLQEIHHKDQQPRLILDSLIKTDNTNQELLLSIIMEISENDISNQKVVFPIIDYMVENNQYSLSEEDYKVCFLVIQHSDIDAQIKYSDFIETLMQKKLIPVEDYMMYIDRLMVNQNKKQIYGYQYYSPSYKWLIQYPITHNFKRNWKSLEVKCDLDNEHYLAYGELYPSIHLKDNEFAIIGSLSSSVNDDMKNHTFRAKISKQKDVIIDKNGYFSFIINKKNIPDHLTVFVDNKPQIIQLNIEEDTDFKILNIIYEEGKINTLE